MARFLQGSQIDVMRARYAYLREVARVGGEKKKRRPTKSFETTKQRNKLIMKKLFLISMKR